LNMDGVQSAHTVEPTYSSSSSSSSSRSRRINNSGNLRNNLDVPFLHPNDIPTSGVVVESNYHNNNDNDNDYRDEDDVHDRYISSSSSQQNEIWKLNVVMALISCFVAMTLTGWGSTMTTSHDVQEHIAANPTVGRMNMTMIGISQWLTILLYIWTLLAPTIFPDRDFN
jgi:hypothetical protein